MKKFLFFLLTLILTFTTVLFTSCKDGGDNDESNGAMTVKLEIVVPGEKIYTFKNTTDKFDNGKKTVYLKAYLDYLAAEEGLVVKIDSAGYVEGFYGYIPNRNTEYFKIYIDGRTSNYGVKNLKLKNGEKYSFIPEKVVSGGNYAASKYPNFLSESDYWLPTQGIKDATVKIMFLDSVKTINNLTTSKVYLSQLFEEITAADKVNIELGHDASFVKKVDGVSFPMNPETYEGCAWQVYCAYSADWNEDFEDNEVYNISGFATDWDAVDWGDPDLDFDNLPFDMTKLPGYVFDNTVIFIRLVPFGGFEI